MADGEKEGAPGGFDTLEDAFKQLAQDDPENFQLGEDEGDETPFRPADEIRFGDDDSEPEGPIEPSEPSADESAESRQAAETDGAFASIRRERDELRAHVTKINDVLAQVAAAQAQGRQQSEQPQEPQESLRDLAQRDPVAALDRLVNMIEGAEGQAQERQQQTAREQEALRGYAEYRGAVERDIRPYMANVNGQEWAEAANHYVRETARLILETGVESNPQAAAFRAEVLAFKRARALIDQGQNPVDELFSRARQMGWQGGQGTEASGAPQPSGQRPPSPQAREAMARRVQAAAAESPVAAAAGGVSRDISSIRNSDDLVNFVESAVEAGDERVFLELADKFGSRLLGYS